MICFFHHDLVTVYNGIVLVQNPGDISRYIDLFGFRFFDERLFQKLGVFRSLLFILDKASIDKVDKIDGKSIHFFFPRI